MEIEDMVNSESYKVVMATAKGQGVDDPFGLLNPERIVASINKVEYMELDTAEQMAEVLAPILSDIITLYGRARSVQARGTVMINIFKMVEIFAMDSGIPTTVTMMGNALVDVTEEQIEGWKQTQAEMDVMLAAAQAMSDGAE